MIQYYGCYGYSGYTDPRVCWTNTSVEHGLSDCQTDLWHITILCRSLREKRRLRAVDGCGSQPICLYEQIVLLL